MIYGWLADLVVVAHLGFVLFVVFGGLLMLITPRALWFHLPALAWGVLIEFVGFVCPLTYLENDLRQMAGEVGYGESFVSRYLIPVLYPDALTWQLQWLLGALLVGVNVLIYAWLYRRYRSM